MPVYRYACETCGTQFERYLSFKEADQRVICPQGHTQTKKILTAPTVVFKGSGFYVTDHRSRQSTAKEHS